MGTPFPDTPDRLAADDQRQEQEWIAGIRANDAHAFEAVFHAYYRRLCLFAFRYVGTAAQAEELVQDVFCRLWARRGEWSLRGGLGTYLYRSVRNRAIDELRAQGVVSRMESAALPDEPIPGMGQRPPEADEALRAADLAIALQRVVATLPTQCQRVYHLRVDRHLSYIEIAQAMGLSVKRVEALLTRTYKSLREGLAEFR